MSKDLVNYLRFCTHESIDFILNKKESDRNLDGIYNYNDKDLEDDHAFIQWIFPTPRKSNFNETAPILSVDEIKMLRNNKVVINILHNFKNKMFSYWGISPYDPNKLHLLNGHNGLRLSRAIECLTLFGIDIKYILDILNDGIKAGILKPHCEYYTEHINTYNIPIWFIRYYENVKL